MSPSSWVGICESDFNFCNDFMLFFLPLPEALDKPLCIADPSSDDFFSSSSISAATVLPSVAKSSSAMATNLMIPRSGDTPKLSSMALASNVEFLLLVTGCNCDLRAVIVIVYAGSKEPPKSKHAECAIVTRIEDSGR